MFYANSDILYNEAFQVGDRTELAVMNARLKGTRLLSSQIVAYNKAGVTMEGSPLLVVEETKDLIDIEINSIYEEGLDKAAQLRARGDIEDQKAQNALDQAEFSAKSITIGGVTNSLQRIFGIT